jgi:transposase
VRDAAGEQALLFDAAPAPGKAIGRHLRLIEFDGLRAVMFGSRAIHVFDASDKDAEAACIATLSRADLASDIDIAAAFGIHRNTVGRLVARFEREGLAAVVPAKRGPKGPSKLTPEVIGVIAAHASQLPGWRLRDLVAERTGVSLSLSYVCRLAAEHRGAQLELSDPVAGVLGEEADLEEIGGEQDDGRDAGGEATDGASGGETDRDGDARSESSEVAVAAAFDPPPVMPDGVRGRYMGLALYYPALAAVGLIDVARSLFRLPRSERFGVRATLITLFFMTLLSRTTVEAAKHLRRVEFGAVVGSGRAPCVKTLRRKLAELVGQKMAGEFGVRLARRWVDTGIVASAYLYVDGHMKAYTGKRKLQEVWNSQRRMPLPGVESYFVGDGQGRPLLFLTEEISTNLAKAMPRIVEAIREVLGDRRFTVIFDRGGYDGTLFAWLTAEKISFITYQRGNPKLPGEAFARRETRFEGRRVRFTIAEDRTKVGKTGPWRRIVVRTRDGHQTPILTNLGTDVGAARIACLMFARWRQENLFKYMGAHHGLDQLISYGADPADADTLIPNPERKRLDRQIAEKRKQLAALKAGLGDVLLDEPKVGRSAHGLKIAQAGAVRRLRDLETDIDTLVAARKPLPTRIRVADAGQRRDVMRVEHKAIVDRVKISAYNAEEWLLDRLICHYPNPHDVRDLLRSFAELSGTIDTTIETDDDTNAWATGVVVTLDPPDTPIHRRALRGLVDDLNAIGATFPGTQLPVTYQVAMHHSELAA